jgi:GT2 family glycosyltransferase
MSKIQRVFSMSDAVGIVGPVSNAASTQSVPFVKSSETQTAINELPPGVSIDEFGKFLEGVGQDCIVPFVPLVHGFCLTLRENVLREIGYFDEVAFPRGYGEENDFCFRADDSGFVLAIAVDTFIFHAKSKSYTSSDRIQFMKDGMNKFREKHGADRIKNAVRFMEQNPHLKYMRDAVLKEWPDHYSPTI